MKKYTEEELPEKEFDREIRSHLNAVQRSRGLVFKLKYDALFGKILKRIMGIK